MTRSPMTRPSIFSVAAVLCPAVAAGPPALELIRSTIDGGGVMFSTGGAFELSGTIGQPDAGVLTGGPFELTGGFWFGLVSTDCNEDGGVNLFDYSSFTECLAGPNDVVPAECECFDADRSDTVDLRDFAVVQAAYSGP